MTDFEIASLATRLVIGVGQILAVLHGIRVMLRVTTDRETQGKEQAEASERQHVQVMTAAERRHTEAMQAAEQQHTEAMQAADRQHAETMAVLDAQRRALEALIERTAPPRESRM